MCNKHALLCEGYSCECAGVFVFKYILVSMSRGIMQTPVFVWLCSWHNQSYAIVDFKPLEKMERIFSFG